MKIDYVNKTRDEQESDFMEYFKPYADPNCKLCYGTGKRHWIVALNQFQICECVLLNVEATKQMEETLDDRLERLSREAGLPEGEVFN